jgi:hypothetical protein
LPTKQVDRRGLAIRPIDKASAITDIGYVAASLRALPTPPAGRRSAPIDRTAPAWPGASSSRASPAHGPPLRTERTQQPAPAQEHEQGALRVAIVGGLTRATHEWTRAGKALGVHLEHHDGNTTGCRAATLAAMVRRADIVVVITLPNSHNAVAIARRTAASHERILMIVKRLSPSALERVVAEALALAAARPARLAR